MPGFAVIPISKAKREDICPSGYFHIIPMIFRNSIYGHRGTVMAGMIYFLNTILPRITA